MAEGIITGIIASAIFLFITYTINKWVWPEFIAALYKGTKIDGEWLVYYEDSSEPSANIIFKQTGNKIIGNSVVSKNRAGETVERKYKYKGTFLNNSIVLTFEDKNNPLMMGGAMVFHHIDSDAKKMRGKSIYFKPEINDVDASNATLRKKST
tara:strand:+ start:363 stop:821 length:459 start_codon:yes stop_codon:yes gene_type:complete